MVGVSQNSTDGHRHFVWLRWIYLLLQVCKSPRQKKDNHSTSLVWNLLTSALSAFKLYYSPAYLTYYYFMDIFGIIGASSNIQTFNLTKMNRKYEHKEFIWSLTPALN